MQHVIPKRELQNTLHKGTDRLEDSVRRLMSAIVQLRVLDGKQWVTKRVQLLGGNVAPDADDGSALALKPDKFGKVRNLCPGYTKRNQRGAG